MQFLIILAIGMVMVTDRMTSPVIFAPHLSGAVAVITSFLALVLITVRMTRKRIFGELQAGRIPVDLIQKTYSRGQNRLRILALVGQVVLIFGTQWPLLVRSVLGNHIAGLDELVILLPFITWLMAGYYFLYPADRAIREALMGQMLSMAEPVHPIWTRGQFLAFQMQFQLLLIGLPLFFIIAAKDLVDIPRPHIVAFSRPYLARFGLQQFAALTPEVILMAFAALIFLLSPFLVKWVWRARSLPDGELRTKLLRAGRNANLRYRDVLLWPTYGVIVNAAVVGFVGPMRYIMLSDGLIESLTDGQIEAVFGHEIGHVRLHHLPFFLLFAIGSMGLVGLAGMHLQITYRLSEQTLETMVLGGVVVVWFLAFGYISRRFEAQADLFGAKLLSPDFDNGLCTLPGCLRHGDRARATAGSETMCLTGAELFSSALDRTAALNAVPRTAGSWRHGSINQRCAFVVRAAEHLPTLQKFQAQIGWIKILLVLSVAICVVWGLYVLSLLMKMR